MLEKLEPSKETVVAVSYKKKIIMYILALEFVPFEANLTHFLAQISHPCHGIQNILQILTCGAGWADSADAAYGTPSSVGARDE